MRRWRVVAIDKFELGVVQQLMHGPERGVETFVVFLVGRIADADDLSLSVKESSAAAALLRLAGDAEIWRAEVFIDLRDLGRKRFDVRAVFTAGGENRFALLQARPRRSNTRDVQFAARRDGDWISGAGAGALKTSGLVSSRSDVRSSGRVIRG